MKTILTVLAVLLLLAGLSTAVQIMPNTQVLGQNTDGEIIQIYAFPISMFSVGTGFDNPIEAAYDENGNPVIAIGLVGKQGA